MKKINIKRIIYKIKQDYLTLNNVVIVIALMIAFGWATGSLNVLQKNYALQKELDDKSRQLVLAQLDVDNAKLEQRYFNTDEYKELAVRERLGLVTPGEKVLILPKNTEKAKNSDQALSDNITVPTLSNFEQWMNFLLGKNNSDINNR